MANSTQLLNNLVAAALSGYDKAQRERARALVGVLNTKLTAGQCGDVARWLTLGAEVPAVEALIAEAPHRDPVEVHLHVKHPGGSRNYTRTYSFATSRAAREYVDGVLLVNAVEGNMTRQQGRRFAEVEFEDGRVNTYFIDN